MRLNYRKHFFFFLNEDWRNKLLISSVFGRLLLWRYGLCYWWFGGQFSLPLTNIIEQEEKVFVIQEAFIAAQQFKRPVIFHTRWYIWHNTERDVWNSTRHSIQGRILWKQFSVYSVCLYIYTHTYTYIHVCVWHTANFY